MHRYLYGVDLEEYKSLYRDRFGKEYKQEQNQWVIIIIIMLFHLIRD